LTLRSSLRLLLLAWPCCAAAIELGPGVPVSAAPVTFSSPREGATLRGGDLVEVRWVGVPKEAEEVELLLSLDGGRSYSLRLTEELDAESSSFHWRVPNVIADRAALGMRTGFGGREIASAAGPIFQIVSDLGLPSVALRWESGELWVDEQDTETTDRRFLRNLGFSVDPQQIGSAPREGEDLVLPRSVDGRPAQSPRKPRERSLETPQKASREGALSRAPLSIPPRI
jgi:hypothetical protein